MSTTRDTALLTALDRLSPPDHSCSIYETSEEHLAVAIPFIRMGLDRGEKCLYITVENVAACVAKLKALGFQIAIDDLGAGYAGLTSFTQLEPEIAKLDMSLVRGIDTDARRQSIVGSMKRLCDELGIRVVAEGVETTAERDALSNLGCDLLQGYLFARPQKGFEAPHW